ncbi:hypothetical protein HMPREF1396_00130 [Helicobacter pylori GAM114Ai]|nr:hypothetical protein HMPREF1396_00130 [Helicobacter pylori GAM114Ai]
MAIWGIEIKPQHQRVIAKNFNGCFLFVVKTILLRGIGGYFGDEYPFNPQLTPLRTLFKNPTKAFYHQTSAKNSVL